MTGRIRYDAGYTCVVRREAQRAVQGLRWKWMGPAVAYEIVMTLRADSVCKSDCSDSCTV